MAGSVVVIDVEHASAAARAIAEASIGADPGPMHAVSSSSHQVFVGADIVVKIIDAADHSRLDREVAFAAALPTGLSAPMLAAGLHATDSGDVRYGCFARVPGTSPGTGLAGVDRLTALRWARQAVGKLQRLHDRVPAPSTAALLRGSLPHGGFVGRDELLSEIDSVRNLDDGLVVPVQVLDGLVEIAERAPEGERGAVPVHADCHWGNWLVQDQRVTALLDFEWARFGDPAEDWMFLARFSGAHMHAVLDVIVEITGAEPDTLRAACETREAAYVLSDLRLKLQDPATASATTRNVRELLDIVVERSWWQRDSTG